VILILPLPIQKDILENQSHLTLCNSVPPQASMLPLQPTKSKKLFILYVYGKREHICQISNFKTRKNNPVPIFFILTNKEKHNLENLSFG
jgi:hypothetical protein